MRMQHLQPAFFIQRAHDVQGIVFVRQLLQFVTHGALADILDVVVLFGGGVARLRALFQGPVETCAQAYRPDQPDRFFQKCIIVQDAKHLGFNVSDPVEGIEQ